MSTNPFTILSIKSFGLMVVYERVHYREIHLPRYIVYHRVSHAALEEFKTKRKAFQWAKQNRNG
jgi:hypothetical protein